MDIPDALALYQAASKAYFSLLTDEVSEAHFNGRGYTKHDLSKLAEIRQNLKKEAEAEGLLSPNLNSSKIAVAQALVQHGYTS